MDECVVGDDEDLTVEDSLLEEATSGVFVFTVGELSRSLRAIMRSHFSSIWVRGEVSGVTLSARGHLFFKLKDQTGILSSVIFAPSTLMVGGRSPLEEGQMVECMGAVTCYEKRGTYQLVVTDLRVMGWGDLRLAFMALREKLMAEGIFAAEHKKQILRHTERVGVITSARGAVLSDILKTLRQGRYPRFELVLYDTAVQGGEAIDGIRRQLRAVAQGEGGDVDVLILARGGGSLEELAIFNDEGIVRDIYHCPVPVISAIGHENDMVLTDEVADYRAATPTAAAELLLQHRQELIESMTCELASLRETLSERLINLREKSDRGLLQHVMYLLRERTRAERLGLENLILKGQHSISESLSHAKHRLETLVQVLHSLSPQKIQERGYVLVTREQKIITRGEALQRGDRIELHFYDVKRSAQLR